MNIALNNSIEKIAVVVHSEEQMKTVAKLANLKPCSSYEYPVGVCRLGNTSTRLSYTNGLDWFEPNGFRVVHFCSFIPLLTKELK